MKTQLKNKKIFTLIVLIVIFLCLLGLTYAYFLTKIKGNTNTNSIKITTANLEIKYNDGNSNIYIDQIKPGETIPQKTFSVSNTSDGMVNNYSVYLEVIENSLERKEDLVYSLTCQSYSIETNELLGNCDGISSQIFPTYNDLIVVNSIDTGIIQKYTLELKYKETGTNQSVDMNKKVLAKVQIYDLNNFKIGTLAFKMVNNASKGFNGTTFVKNQNVLPGINTVSSNISNMSITKDDYGTSFYYYGNVKNNYVNFNGMCWRALRINGNGTIKLILTDEEADCSSTTLVKEKSAFIKSSGMIQYSTTSDVDYNNSLLKETLENWYRTKFTNETIKSKIENENWCNDLTIANREENIIYYSPNERLSLTNTSSAKPSLICKGSKVISSIGTITSDEIAFTGAGGNQTETMIPSYIVDNANATYWTMSPNYSNATSSNIFQVYKSGSFTTNETTTNGYIRPVIVLNNNITGTGKGTIENPYIIN